MIETLMDVGIWTPSGDVETDYEDFFNLNEEMRAHLRSLEGHSVSLWDVEHAFWWRMQQQSVNIGVVPPLRPISTGEDGFLGLPEGYVPPVVSILPLLAVNDEQVAKLCEQTGRSIEKVFEERIAILFKMFGFVVEALGQGYGRMPDG